MVVSRLGFVGLQTGDEGKGKVVAHVAEMAAMDFLHKDKIQGQMPVLVVRYQGGANAGHTVVVDGEKYKLHQVPSGIVIPSTFNLMDEGVYFEPRGAMKEILELQSREIFISESNFGIASNAHVTFDFHKQMDARESKPTAERKHTSTGRGIWPTAADKYAREGMRFAEFLDRNACLEILAERFAKDRVNAPRPDDLDLFVKGYDAEREFLSQFLVLRTKVLQQHGTHYLIAEGANGFRIDIDKGFYPGVTSSNAVRIPSEFRLDIIYGVVKLYESSVGGERPFIGKMHDTLEAELRERFGERGTTTNLPRDLGWFDAVAVRHAVKDTGTDFLISSCGDRLECLGDKKEEIKLVTGYEIDGKVYTEWDASFHKRKTLYGARPVFEKFEPWSRFVDDSGRLTEKARRYVDRIQEFVGAEFIMHGYGEDIKDVVELRNPLNPDPKKGTIADSVIFRV